MMRNQNAMQMLLPETKMKKSGGGPIAPNGAWHMPRTGDSPKGLKSGLQDYQPEEWVQ